jgi:hypothetical protein
MQSHNITIYTTTIQSQRQYLTDDQIQKHADVVARVSFKTTVTSYYHCMKIDMYTFLQCTCFLQKREKEEEQLQTQTLELETLV